MIVTGKCPKCGTTVGGEIISNTKLEHVTVGSTAFGPAYKGISIVCTGCNSVLGMSIDPLVIKEGIIDEILGGLGQSPRRR